MNRTIVNRHVFYSALNQANPHWSSLAWLGLFTEYMHLKNHGRVITDVVYHYDGLTGTIHTDSPVVATIAKPVLADNVQDTLSRVLRPYNQGVVLMEDMLSILAPDQKEGILNSLVSHSGPIDLGSWLSEDELSSMAARQAD